jgi:hypothetical protein
MLKINDYLDITGKCLVRYLYDRLPAISNNWWQDAVIEKLSYSQAQRVSQKNTTKLEELDLACLLRVFDQNWYELSQKKRSFSSSTGW